MYQHFNFQDLHMNYKNAYAFKFKNHNASLCSAYTCYIISCINWKDSFGFPRGYLGVLGKNPSIIN